MCNWSQGNSINCTSLTITSLSILAELFRLFCHFKFPHYLYVYLSCAVFYLVYLLVLILVAVRPNKVYPCVRPPPIYPSIYRVRHPCICPAVCPSFGLPSCYLGLPPLCPHVCPRCLSVLITFLCSCQPIDWRCQSNVASVQAWGTVLCLLTTELTALVVTFLFGISGVWDCVVPWLLPDVNEENSSLVF